MRRSIAELCVVDHRSDPQVLAKWLANKNPRAFISWIESGSHLHVAEENGRIVAVAAMKNSGEITLNYVSPDARFRGVSKAMMAALENEARRLGLAECFLTSTDTAHAFYLALGYRDNGSETSVFTSRLAHRMRKSLQDF
jgi:N-acetylglutamate synthase-like GNAT family acetyltransferase